MEHNHTIQLIAIDMDGTLLDEHGDLPAAVLPVIKEVEARGVHVSLVSGRPTIFMQHIADALDLNGAMVSFNGGAIVEQGKLIKASPFSMGPLKSVLQRADEAGATVLIYTDWEAFALRESEWVIKNKHTIRRYTIRPFTDEEWKEMEIFKIAILYHHDGNLQQKIDTLLDPFDGHYCINRYGSRLCEIMDGGVDKGAGLEALARLLEIPLEATLAIGDDVNDVTMLKRAGIGVAVNNAAEIAKAASDYVTEGSNTAGVIEAIRRFA